MIEAEYTGANNSLVCVPGVNDFVQVEYVNNASASVLWSGPDVLYSLETETDPLTGMICVHSKYFYLLHHHQQLFCTIVLLWLECVHHVYQCQAHYHWTVDGVMTQEIVQ